MRAKAPPALPGYNRLLGEIADVIALGRRQAVWSLNAIMSAVYWEIGRQIVEFEQKGRAKAEYGERIISLLADDLHARFGRGFRKSNLYQFRKFFLAYQDIFQTPSGKLKGDAKRKFQTVSGKSAPAERGLNIFQTVSGKSSPDRIAAHASAFTLPWSHYARLLSVKNDAARNFYEVEALRGGWSFRQLDRQISSQLYERLALSSSKTAVLSKAAKPRRDERSTAEHELRDPYVLEFLNLKDEYS
ncbi:MAG TPA: DUF1016 N-terminal domain-containing protein, partial [Chthoniobacterales bacterium]